MSILLETLKKAALEKQKEESKTGQNEPKVDDGEEKKEPDNEDTHLDLDLSFKEENSEQENTDEHDLDSEIDTISNQLGTLKESLDLDRKLIEEDEENLLEELSLIEDQVSNVPIVSSHASKGTASSTKAAPLKYENKLDEESGFPKDEFSEENTEPKIEEYQSDQSLIEDTEIERTNHHEPTESSEFEEDDIESYSEKTNREKPTESPGEKSALLEELKNETKKSKTKERFLIATAYLTIFSLGTLVAIGSYYYGIYLPNQYQPLTPMLAQEDTTTHYEQEENFPQTANDQEPIEELLFPTDLVESESQKSLDIDKIEEIEKIETIGLLAQVDPKEEPTPEISVVKPVKEKPIVAKKKPIIQETKNKIKPLPAKTLAKTKNPVPRKKIKVNQPKNELKKLDALIGAAYKNFQIGHILIAKEKYQEALRLAPDNRDVLLGNAAVAMAEQEYAYALELYHNRLAIDPSDEYALSGIISISSLGNPSPDLMTRVNKLISTHPNATHLHFMKGSMEAANNQWPAAKKSFSIAWYKQPNKIEYTYNLAIALDHLNETQEAIRLYRSTLELAGHNSNSLIDIQSVISRLKILARRND